MLPLKKDLSIVQGAAAWPEHRQETGLDAPSTNWLYGCNYETHRNKLWMQAPPRSVSTHSCTAISSALETGPLRATTHS